MSMQRDVPESLRKLYGRCLLGIVSPRQAIKMQCLECVSYVREEVELCTDKGCPLYAFRPHYNLDSPLPEGSYDATSDDIGENVSQ